MNKAKKWMVTLSDEQYGWIKKTSEEVDMPGSEVVRELLDRCMKENQKEFKEELIAAKAQIRLRELTEKKMTLEEEIRNLKSHVGQKVYA